MRTIHMVTLAILITMLCLFDYRAATAGQDVTWRCWAEKVVPHGDARCTAVFTSDSKHLSRKYALEICLSECGGQCRPLGCSPHRRVE